MLSRLRSMALFQLIQLLLLSTGESVAPLPEFCEVSAVGAGWAGVYFAFRQALTGKKVCIFEGTDRIGGRTYSHRMDIGDETFTLDVGAYRFSPDMHLPGDVIKLLGFKTACYEPNCPPASQEFPEPFHFNYTAPLRRIVDAEGMPAGYVTAIRGMLDQILASGGQLFMEANLTDVQALHSQEVRLVFDTRAVLTKSVLLNLPRAPFLSLQSLRSDLPERTVQMANCVKFDVPTKFFPPGSFTLGKSLTKAYAYYADAWWHNHLNQTVGQWPENAFEPVNTSEGIPIGIHWNDGPVRCNAPLQGCRGFLEVFYSTTNEDFFEDLRPSDLQPLGILKGKAAEAKLQRLHAAVMEATKPLFQKKSVAQPKEPPSMLVVGVWDRTGHGFTAPTKVYYSKDETTPGGPDPLEKACGVPGLTDKEYRDSLLFPHPDHKQIMLANNDWVAQPVEKMFGDWAEESLLQAERALHGSGLGRPAWLDEDYYNRKVLGIAEGDIVTMV
ncbi:Hypothetical protein SCF082_LOCUS19047 [Durusdinium trenchii]|uniref:Amine oxidase domain-containing protein n=2 Tax=Durusdinium trenchii TaxID=1381693 RepID=A0ABP0KT18_9DINO